MSGITFGDEYDFDSIDVSSYSADYVPPVVNRVQPSRVSDQYAASPLWSIDESVESGRFERIQKRLVRLEAALYEDYGSRLDLDSRESLLRLFVACPSIQAPLISAQRDGVLFATWRGQDSEELVIKFISPKLIHYSLMTKSQLDFEKVDRSYGTIHSPPTFFVHYPIARKVAER